MKNWVTYLDEEEDKVGAIEDDHLGVDTMVKSRPGWKLLGYVADKNIEGAIKYAQEVFC